LLSLYLKSQAEKKEASYSSILIQFKE